MHEMSIAESIVGIVEAEAAKQNYARVKTVRVEIGPFAGIETEALKFSFDAVTRGSLAENARLEIIHVEARAWCLPCGRSVPLTQRYSACPRCGSHQLQMTSGEEMRIKDLEVE